MKAKQFRIKGGWARREGLPASFVAVQLRETARAVYLYGHGSADPEGHCARCGRLLTHPGSIVIGIGPECLGDWGLRDVVLDNMTEEQKAALRTKIQEQVIDTWLPKSVIVQELETEEEVEPPADHKMAGQGARIKVERKVTALNDEIMKITFPYNPKDVALVKSLPDRRFHNKDGQKFWTAWLDEWSVKKLRDAGFVIDSSVEKALADFDSEIRKIGDIETLSLELYPFQKEGVEFIESRHGRALVADEMGLGKTVQALAWLELHPEARPAIIICPASLKLNWKKEAHRWLSKPNVEVLSGTTPEKPSGSILIINYDILSHWKGVLSEISAKVLVLDEVHYIKNNKAKRTKAVKELAKGVPHVIGLSGTPIVNRPVEIYNAVKLINPKALPSFWTFAQRYCGARHNGFGWDFTGATNTMELHQKLSSTVMIRRKKSEVLKDLPEKQRSFVPIELNNRGEYEKAELSFISWVKENRGKEAAARASNAEALTKIEVLKQLAVAGKMNAAMDWIRDFLEVDGKLVVFATHKVVIDRLMEEFGDRAVKIDGSTTGKAREEAVERFQNDESCRLFVGNMKAAGVGITLTAASSVAFLELPWTPGELTQAEDRVHRIGQQGNVMIYYLLAADTIEEEVASMLDSKRKVLDNVLDGRMTEEESLLSMLLAKYREESGE